MSDTISPEFTLGICGDGQLARLLALTAQQWGISCAILTTDITNSPCKHICSQLIEAKNWNDVSAFDQLVSKSDVVVLENEFVSAELLATATKENVRFLPDYKSYEQLSNKLKQVQFAESLGIPVPAYTVLDSPEQIHQVHGPHMLKHIRGGYDGYGNFTFVREDQRQAAIDFVSRGGISLAQEFLRFDTEVAVVVAKSKTASVVFPVMETLQEKNICHFVMTPPRLAPHLGKKIQDQAKFIIDALPGEGLFAVEFFVKDEEVIFNEIAPRPHNSAHLTMEACSLSQYDALLRLALDLPLPTPELRSPAAGMLNLLGNGGDGFSGAAAFFTEGHFHLYGKKESRLGRKIGHYTLLGQDGDELLKKLKTLKESYRI